MPVAVEGLLDLGGWQFTGDGQVRISGQWEFYWGRLLAPHDFQQAGIPGKTGWFSMPGVWNGTIVDGRKLPGSGCATFRLRILLDSCHERVALLIPYAFTAYRLWVDDRLTAMVGRVGSHAEEMVPKYHTRTVFIDPQDDGEIVLTLQISNFMHAKGGMRDPIRLVDASQAFARKHTALIKDVLVFGCLLIMSLYHLVLFAFRPADRFNLYFALCCLLFGLRAALTGEVFLIDLFERMDWRITVRLEWLCAYTGGPLGLAYIRSLFPDECSRRIHHGSLLAAALLAPVTLAAPTTVFTSLFPYLTPLIGLILGYSAWVLFRATRRKRYGAALMLVSMVLVIAAVINDILYTNDLIHTGHYIPYGMILFVCSQSIILANRSARTFQRLETTNNAYVAEIGKRERAQAEVKAYQDHLKDLVRERTYALAVANERLRQELDEREAAETETLKLQAQLQRSQKMEALGTLAGGVAHDLNNILSGIVGYPDLLLQDLPPDSELKRPLRTIQQSGQKAAAIVQDLLTLARRGVADFNVVDLNAIVSDYFESPEFSKLLQFHPTVEVRTELSTDRMLVKGSSVHLFKTVMNLVSNAAEAMPDGGVVRIKTVHRDVDRPIGDYDTAREGRYVLLIVQDTGIGISETDMARIFEPFYTKKVMGKSGTGLGMAVVWGTVKDHAGFIDVQSREGVGTTLTLYFPSTNEQLKAEPDRWSLADGQGHGETILVVDDVEDQREIACAMLIRLGYRVESVSNGEAAVAHVAGKPVDLLLLDMMMDPGIDGLETYQRILQIHSSQKAVITSGFAENERVRHAERIGPATYLKKPYRLETLADAVQTVLT